MFASSSTFREYPVEHTVKGIGSPKNENSAANYSHVIPNPYNVRGDNLNKVDGAFLCTMKVKGD